MDRRGVRLERVDGSPTGSGLRPAGAPPSAAPSTSTTPPPTTGSCCSARSSTSSGSGSARRSADPIWPRPQATTSQPVDFAHGDDELRHALAAHVRDAHAARVGRRWRSRNRPPDRARTSGRRRPCSTTNICAARTIIVEGEHPDAGPFTYVGTPVIVDGEPFTVRPASARARRAHRRGAGRPRLHRRRDRRPPGARRGVVTAPADLGPHHPARWAARRAHATAVTVRDATGPDGVIDVMTYGQLAERSAQLARALRRRGLRTGDGVATVCSNRCRADRHRVGGAAQRAVLHADLHLADRGRVRPHRRRLRRLGDRGERRPRIAGRRGGRAVRHAGADRAGWRCRRVRTVVRRARCRGRRSARRRGRGLEMFYSSGTTGRPKGDPAAALERPIAGAPNRSVTLVPRACYGFGADTVYLSPAPLYHAAPLGWSIGDAAPRRHGGGDGALRRRARASR